MATAGGGFPRPACLEPRRPSSPPVVPPKTRDLPRRAFSFWGLRFGGEAAKGLLEAAISPTFSDCVGFHPPVPVMIGTKPSTSRNEDDAER